MVSRREIASPVRRSEAAVSASFVLAAVRLSSVVDWKLVVWVARWQRMYGRDKVGADCVQVHVQPLLAGY